MKKYLVKIDIIEYERAVDDPIVEVVDYSIGIKVNFRNKEYGQGLICSDTDKLKVLPLCVKEYLEMVFTNER